MNEWSKLLAITGSSQIVVQALGFLSGIVIINLLSIKEYALYTVANTMLGTMTMLADSGISSGVMAEGGKVWEDKKKLGTVLATGLKLRKRFGVISLFVTLPVLAYLLLEHGASWLSVVLIIVSIIPAFFAALSDSLYEIVPRLHQDVKALQRNQIEVGFGRGVLSTLLLIIFPFTYIALIANSIPRIYGNLKLAKMSSKHADGQQTDPIVKQNIVKGVKRTMPIVIYHCVSGQISIWLITFFGSTTSIAQLGALGRISMMFALFTTLFSTLVIPRFSRMKVFRKGLLPSFLAIQAVTLIIGAGLVVGTYLFSNQILWVFGDKYQGANYLLLLIAISSSLVMMVEICSQLSISRGWFIKPYFLIGINFASIVGFLYFFNFSSLENVLFYNIMSGLFAYILVLGYGSFQCVKYKPAV